ncbi:MAG: M24 family metallopeptidase [Candidatus Woesearchaeota archaeon]
MNSKNDTSPINSQSLEEQLPHIVEKRRRKLSSILQPKEILLFHTRDSMSKGDDEYFHSCDSWFRYYFLNAGSTPMFGIVLSDSQKQISSILAIKEQTEIQKKFLGEINIIQIQKQSNIEMILEREECIEKIISLVVDENYKLSIALPKNVNYNNSFKQLIQELKEKIKKRIDNYPKSKRIISTLFENKINELIQFREIKDKFEIECIKKANSIAQESFEELLKDIDSYSTEQEVFAKLSYEIFKRNSTHSFYPIVASGKNALTLHYNKHNSPLLKKELLLLDFGCEYLGYKSDISRTIHPQKKFSQLQKDIYNSVLKVQQFAISIVREGLSFKEFEKEVAQKMAKELIKLKIISREEYSQNPQIIREYFPHRCSHHLGLDTHDVGSYEEMKENMVITIEPGLYIKELKIGIRIEDNVLIAKNGCINLSNTIKKEVEELEI